MGAGGARDLERRALAGAVLRILAGTLVLRLNLRCASRRRNPVPAPSVAACLARQEREQAATAGSLAGLAARLGCPSLAGPREIVRLSSVAPSPRTAAPDASLRQALIDAHERLAADCETAWLLAAAAGDEDACAILGRWGRAHAAAAMALRRLP